MSGSDVSMVNVPERPTFLGAPPDDLPCATKDAVNSNLSVALLSGLAHPSSAAFREGAADDLRVLVIRGDDIDHAVAYGSMARLYPADRTSPIQRSCSVVT